MRTGGLRALRLGLVGVLLCLATAVSAQRLTLSVEQMRQAVVLSYRSGDLDQAQRLSEALLARDPTDRVAIITLTETLSAKGDHAAAARVAAAGYRQPDAPRDFYYLTARLAAREHTALAQGTRAQIWLRRAREFSPDAETAAQIAQDYAAIRARNPLRVQLGFGLRPTSNINNGSSEATQEILYFGIPLELNLSGDARALSGVGVSAAASLRYLLKGTATQATYATLSAAGTTYLMSAEARAMAPESSGADFAFASAQAGLAHGRAVGEAGGNLNLAANIGQVWSGGPPLFRFANASIDRAFALSDDRRLTLGARIERQFSDRNAPLRDLRQVSVDYGLRLQGGADLSLGATLLDGQSADANYDYRGLSLSADLGLAQPVFGGDIDLYFDLGGRVHASSRTTATNREDVSVRGRVSYSLADTEYFGFVPKISLTLQANNSNIERYQTRAFDIGFDLVSAF